MTEYQRFKQYSQENIVLTDGAMGTYFDEIAKEHALCSEEANLFHRETILQIHRAYIAAGAVLLRSNTFSANQRTFQEIREKHGGMEEYTLAKFIEAGYSLAMQAKEEAEQQGKTVFVAADIGPVYADSDRKEEEILEEYYEIVDAFLHLGADIFVMETFPDERDMLKVAQYIRKKKKEVFLIGQFSFVPTGYSRTGFHYKTVIKKAADSQLLDAVGFNCGIGAAHMEKFLAEYLRTCAWPENVLLTALPNCGYPQIIRGRVVYSESVDYFGQKVLRLPELGVGILGGCCGTTPEYIEEICRRLKRKEKHIVIRMPEKKQGKEKKPQPVRNSFREKMEKGEPVIAVELDPPFDPMTEKMMDGARMLMGGTADILTIADSPLARSRADSLLTAVKIQKETGIPVMPHLSCRDRNRIAIRSGVLGAYIHDIRNMLIVTGDPVGREERAFTRSVFDFNSIKLMEFMESLNEELFHGDTWYYGGALNQNAARKDKIAERMKRKIDAGCQYFLTQPVYAEEEIEKLDWLREQTGAKILIGVMPLVSYRNALFIKNEMPGIHVPDQILARYSPEGNREEWEETAVEISRKIMEAGKDTGAGYYLMTPFHRVSLIKKIIEVSKHDKR